MRRFLLWFLPKWDAQKEKVFTVIRPGFRGPVPYVLPLRYLFLLVIVLRVWLYPGGAAQHAWSALILLSVLLTAFATYLTLGLPERDELRRHANAAQESLKTFGPPTLELLYCLVVLADICLISWAYRLTGDPTSGIFLLYCLPVFTAAEYLGPLPFLVVAAVTEASIIFTTASLQPAHSIHGLVDAVFNRAAIRGSFLLSIAFVTSSVIRVERSLRKRLDRRDEQFRVLLDFREDASKVLDTGDVLPLAVEKAISLVSKDGFTTGAGMLIDSSTHGIQAEYSNPGGFFETDEGKGLIDRVAQQHPVSVKSFLTNEYRPIRPYTRKVVHASLCVPIISRDTPIGLLFLRRIGGYIFNQSDQWFLQALAGHAAAAIERAQLTSALDSLGTALPSALQLDRQLDYVLSELTENLGFEFATISLVDEYRGVIETVRGRSVPWGWLSRARKTLDTDNIHTDVVRTKNTVTIEAWDHRLDPDIYERFEHSKLARVFVPIISDQEAVGTIEAGCRLERKDSVITSSAVAEVERIGKDRGRDLGRYRPHVLLELIAQSAIAIIGADSASVHVYRKDQSSERGIDGLGEPILAAGAGRATKEFIREHQPRPGGLGQRAMEEANFLKIDDPQKLKTHNADLFDLGIRSMAAFPMSLGQGVQGVLYVHFWGRDHEFSPSELDLGELFTRQIEVVIQNHLLLRTTTELAARAWELSRMQNLMQSLASPFDLRDVLEKVTQNVLMMVDADNVTLYQYEAGSDHFVTPPVMRGIFHAEESMRTGIYPEDTPRWALKEGRPQFFPRIPDVLCSVKPDGKPRFAVREGIASCAIVPLRAGREVVGLLFVNYRSPREFNLEDQNIINALADSAALVIRTARLQEPRRIELERRQRELEAMHAVDMAMVESAPDLPEVLELILLKVLDITKAQSGEFMLVDAGDKETLVSEARLPAGPPQRTQKISEGLIGLAARSKQSVLAADVNSVEWEPHYLRLTPTTRSELAVPLLEANGDVLGVLDIESDLTNKFTADDKLLMETLAVQAVIAIHSVKLYGSLERRIRHLAALNMIAARVQGQPYELEVVLRLFLTGISAGAGLGFSRVMLFLADDGGNSLHGEVAAGSVTRREAEVVWNGFQSRSVPSLRDLELLLHGAEQFSAEIRQGKIVENSPLSRAIRLLSLPIESSSGAVAQCLLEGRTVVIEYEQPDTLRAFMGQFTQPNDVEHAYACVPLIGRHTKRIGVLVVDNRFLLKERYIDEEDKEGLEAFGGLLALSIENTRLRARLAEEEKIENRKEVTAGIVHTVGTRLSVMAGSVTRLQACLEAGEAYDAMLDRLMEGIKNAERVLRDLRTFAAAFQLQRDHADLGEVIEDLHQDVKGTFRLEIVTQDQPMPVCVDRLKFVSALMEIIKNCHEAMLGVSDEPVRIETAECSDQSPVAPKGYAQVEITDKGPGIRKDAKPNVFKPFFTTKHGTGMGLAIAKTVVDGHGGTILADDNPGGGARFVIRIPIVPKPVVTTQGEANG